LSVRLAAAGTAAVVVAVALNIARHYVKPFLMSHFAAKNWADVLLTTMNIRHDSPPTLGYALFYGGLGVALVGYLGLLSQREPVGVPVRVVRLAAVIGRASFVSYVLQQWVVDFIPIWMGFDSWLTPVTAPLYLVINTVLMYWVAEVWSRHNANRFMTFGLRAGSRPLTIPPAAVAVLLLFVVVNLLALANAPRLTPAKLALFPTNPYPWSPARLAGHSHQRF
jgi:hypothetical protein